MVHGDTCVGDDNVVPQVTLGLDEIKLVAVDVVEVVVTVIGEVEDVVVEEEAVVEAVVHERTVRTLLRNEDVEVVEDVDDE